MNWNWVYAYNKQGMEGLSDTSGRGQRCKLNADQLQWLRQRLEEGPPPESGLSVFHGKDIQQMIEQQFGLTYHLHSIYKLLHRLGYSGVSSRPEHSKGDPAARETLKKKR